MKINPIKLTERFESEIDIRWFVSETTQRGTVMGASKKDNLVVPYHKGLGGAPIGILLSDVVNKDLSKQHLNFYNGEVQQGGKVQILRRGQIMVKMAKSLRMPYGQPIYVDRKSGSITWKKTGPRIGTLARNQGSDGWCSVSIEI